MSTTCPAGLCVASGVEDLREVGKGQVAVTFQRRTSDQLSVGDSRPVSRGEAGSAVEVAFQPCGLWRWMVSGRFSGAWFDFDGPSVSGNIQDWGWGVGVGMDRLFPLGQRVGARVFLGASFDYGQARSKVENLVITDEGPRQFQSGGALRLGVDIPLANRLDLTAQFTHGVYNAHARDWSVRKEYNWVGTSFAAGLGLRWHPFGSSTR